MDFFQQRFLDKDSMLEYSNTLYAQIKERYKSLKLLNQQESQVFIPFKS